MSYPSSIRRQDSNPRHLEHESPPITTRPGLPLKVHKLLQVICAKKSSGLVVMGGDSCSKGRETVYWMDTFTFICCKIVVCV